MDALAEIEKEAPYKDRFTFEIVPIASPKGKASDEKYDWEKQLHGMVILKPDGTLHTKLPGHKYDRPEIIAALDKVLGK